MFFGKLWPLYLFVALGWLAGRKLAVRKESIAPLLIFMITPMVILKGTLATPLDPARLMLPLIVFVVCCTLCLLSFQWAPFQSPAKNILAFAAGNCNSGYFGLPAATALLGEEAFAQAVMISFGFILYENTVGFYVSARGHATPKQALDRVLRLPSAYAFAIGISLRLLDVHVPESIETIFTQVRGAYTVLGMMLIGLALSDIRRFSIDWRFTGYALGMKYVAWPLCALAIIWIDKQAFHVFDVLAQRGLLIASALPLAANTVAIATLHNAEPEKASVAVLVSTVIALLIIPSLGALF